MTFGDWLRFRLLEAAIGVGIALVAYPIIYLVFWRRGRKRRR